MVNQKAISVKLDVDTLLDLDAESSLGYMKRNRIINVAVRMYLDAKDTKRRWRHALSIEEKAAEYARFNLRWFPAPMVRSLKAYTFSQINSQNETDQSRNEEAGPGDGD